MNEGTILRLAALAGVLAVGSFLVLGTTRLVLGFETAQIVAAPLFAGGFVLAALVFVLSVLVKVGAIELEEG